MRPPLNHMMLHSDALADEYEAILGYRTTHAGLVLPAAGVGVGVDNILLEDGSNLLLEDGSVLLKE